MEARRITRRGMRSLRGIWASGELLVALIPAGHCNSAFGKELIIRPQRQRPEVGAMADGEADGDGDTKLLRQAAEGFLHRLVLRIDAAERDSFRGVFVFEAGVVLVVAVFEIAKDDRRGSSECAGLVQLSNHAVDAIPRFADIFEKEDLTLG